MSIIRDFLAVPEILNLRSTSKFNLKEQDDAYATGHVKSYGFDVFAYTSVLAANWVISKKIRLRSFTLKLQGLPLGITSLHRVCETNEAAIANLMLACGTQDVNELSVFAAADNTTTTLTAFHTACRTGRTGIVKAFLRDSQQRTQVNHPDNSGVTPLMVACGAGHLEVVEALLAHPDIDLNLSEKKIGVNALYAASLYSHIDIVNALLADQRVLVNQSNVFGLVPLTAAVFSGNVDLFKALVSDKRTDVNQETHGGDTPLNISASKGFLPAVKLLLNRSSTRVNQQNMQGKTPLFSAAANGRLAIVQALLQDDRVNVNTRDSTNKTPYRIAVSNGHAEIAKLLLEDLRFEADLEHVPNALLLGNE